MSIFICNVNLIIAYVYVLYRYFSIDLFLKCNLLCKKFKKCGIKFFHSVNTLQFSTMEIRLQLCIPCVHSSQPLHFQKRLPV